MGSRLAGDSPTPGGGKPGGGQADIGEPQIKALVSACCDAFIGCVARNRAMQTQRAALIQILHIEAHPRLAVRARRARRAEPAGHLLIELEPVVCLGVEALDEHGKSDETTRVRRERTDDLVLLIGSAVLAKWSY